MVKWLRHHTNFVDLPEISEEEVDYFTQYQFKFIQNRTLTNLCCTFRAKL